MCDSDGSVKSEHNRTNIHEEYPVLFRYIQYQATWAFDERVRQWWRQQSFLSFPKSLWERTTGSSASTTKKEGLFEVFPDIRFRQIDETEFQDEHFHRDVRNEVDEKTGVYLFARHRKDSIFVQINLTVTNNRRKQNENLIVAVMQEGYHETLYMALHCNNSAFGSVQHWCRRRAGYLLPPPNPYCAHRPHPGYRGHWERIFTVRKQVLF